MLPKEAIEEFKQIYKKEYGVMLSEEEATEKASNLINVFKLLSEPKVRTSSDQGN